MRLFFSIFENGTSFSIDQMLVISKRFEQQQRDCAQTKDLLKQF